MSPITFLIALYGIASIAVLYLFLMDRAALELFRSMNLPESQRGAIQSPIPSFPLTIVSWVVLFFIWREAGWLIAVLLLAAPWVLAITLPVPRNYFHALFRRRIVRLGGTPTF